MNYQRIKEGKPSSCLAIFKLLHADPFIWLFLCQKVWKKSMYLQVLQEIPLKSSEHVQRII
jgi:hypothetical protein